MMKRDDLANSSELRPLHFILEKLQAYVYSFLGVTVGIEEIDGCSKCTLRTWTMNPHSMFSNFAKLPCNIIERDTSFLNILWFIKTYFGLMREISAYHFPSRLLSWILTHCADPKSSSGRDGISISSGIWELANIEKSFVQLSLRRLVKEDWGKMPSVPITPPAPPNSSSLFFSTLMLISPFRGLLLRTVSSREPWIMIDRKFCIMFSYAFCDITEMNNFALDRTSFYTFDLTSEFLF